MVFEHKLMNSTGKGFGFWQFGCCKKKKPNQEDPEKGKNDAKPVSGIGNFDFWEVDGGEKWAQDVVKEKTRLRKMGFIVNNGLNFFNFSNINHVFMDKSLTLTTGTLDLKHIYTKRQIFTINKRTNYD
jgi:hypothetical protein